MVATVHPIGKTVSPLFSVEWFCGKFFALEARMKVAGGKPGETRRTGSHGNVLLAPEGRMKCRQEPPSCAVIRPAGARGVIGLTGGCASPCGRGFPPATFIGPAGAGQGTMCLHPIHRKHRRTQDSSITHYGFNIMLFEACLIDVIRSERTTIFRERTTISQERMAIFRERTSIFREQTSIFREQTSIIHEQTSIIHEGMTIRRERTSIRREKMAIVQEKTPIFHEGMTIGHEGTWNLRERMVIRWSQSWKVTEPSVGVL
jgi:hypothetical protein